MLLVGAIDRFTLIYASQVTDATLAQAPDPALRTLSWRGPVLVGARLPTDAKERADILFSAVSTGIDVENLPRYYVPFAQVAPQLLARSQRVDALRMADRSGSASLASAIESTGEAADALRAVPIQSLRGQGTTFIDARTAQPLQTLPFALDTPPAPPR